MRMEEKRAQRVKRKTARTRIRGRMTRRRRRRRRRRRTKPPRTVTL